MEPPLPGPAGDEGCACWRHLQPVQGASRGSWKPWKLFLEPSTARPTREGTERRAPALLSSCPPAEPPEPRGAARPSEPKTRQGEKFKKIPKERKRGNVWMAKRGTERHMTARKEQGEQKKACVSPGCRDRAREQPCHGKAPGQGSKAQGNPPARAEHGAAAAAGKRCTELVLPLESPGASGKPDPALAALPGGGKPNPCPLCHELPREPFPAPFPQPGPRAGVVVGMEQVAALLGAAPAGALGRASKQWPKEGPGLCLSPGG